MLTQNPKAVGPREGLGRLLATSTLRQRKFTVPSNCRPDTRGQGGRSRKLHAGGLECGLTSLTNLLRMCRYHSRIPDP